ncbi:MAG: PP2C family protein-serine/threonine phosphatase [Pseudodesulfovibrio sp.]|uniref:PP2C family protein-serine/threonine phosphatase n=1 Tax=Pseudodesulfovibrio sp. TaxID=2035812 RepID=UPI003D0BD120
MSTAQNHCLDLATILQGKMLPAFAPDILGLNVFGDCHYATKLGGDFFDYFDFREACCRSDTRLRLVVGDAAGHGVNAALVMTTVRAYIRGRAMQPGDIHEVVNDVNKLLTKDLMYSGNFVSMFFLDLSMLDNTLSWVVAGHDPALLFDSNTDTFELLSGQGIPLGVEPEYTYPINSREALQPGQILVLCTDGIWETTNNQGQQFGKDRLRQIIRNHSGDSMKELVGTVYADLKSFSGQHPLQDDATIVAIKAVETQAE